MFSSNSSFLPKRAIADFLVHTLRIFACPDYNDNPPAPHRVFHKLVRASDVCKRDAFRNLETWPPRLERSIQIPHCLQFPPSVSRPPLRRLRGSGPAKQG